MDRITRKLIEELIASYELISRGIAKDFELYVNHCIVSDYVDGLFDIENVTVGNGNDTCIDGLAIIVNGQVIENQEQIERLVEERIKIDVKYIFIQSKSGEKFEKKYINEFGTGVNDFFDVNPKLPRNNDIKRIASISDLIIENPRLLKRNPDCKLFYVTSGIKRDNDINHNAIISMHRESLESTNLFKDVSFELLGAREIRELFRRSINPIIAEFEFSNRIILHEHLPGIKEAHFGALPLDQFLNILLDKNGNQKPVFEDNVRDFQGASNAVNQKISETLMSESPELFTVLNNGITIVASSVKITGSRFVLEDYQIVNGCQTSNMIYDALESLKDSSIQIPIKLIITEDENIKNQITIATNSQIAVKREQLHVMTKFQKDLEQFYLASKEEELYYERRSGQYNSNNKICKARIISLQNQIKSFSALFLENPHKVTSYFGGVVRAQIEADNPSIFSINHPLKLYYVAGLAFYRIETYFKSGILNKDYKKIKFFILMLFRKLIISDTLQLKNIQNQKSAKEHAQLLLDVLINEEECIKYFQQAISIWTKAGFNLQDKEILKQASTTDCLINQFNITNP